jgi:4-hydroxyphenylpyruvate dioxygenase
MLYSIATVCLSGLLKDKIPAIAKAGFRGIELFENDVITHPGTVAEIRQMVEDHGLEVVAYQPFRDFEGLPEPFRKQTLERAKRKLDLTSQLGCDLMMVCSSVSPDSDGGIIRAAADFSELGELAAERDMRVAFEALAWGRQINDYRDSWEVVRRADHDNVGLCLDTFHIFSRDTDLKAIKNIPGDRIFLVQIADAPRLSMDTLSWSRHYRCFPGQGELPLGKFMHNLVATGYDGPLSLEVFNDQFRSGEIERTAADGYRSLVFLNAKTERRDQQSLAPQQQPNGIGFLEFAIEPDQRDAFRQLITAMGFTLAGNHRAKAVEHWQQGEIHFVLNFEKDSFAESYYHQHGSSVCAIALLFDKIDEVTSRASDLNYPRYFGDPTRNDRGNPGIDGLSENLLYFVANTESSCWESDFERTKNFQNQSYLERIDHISVTLSYEEMLRETLLYRAMFGMKAGSGVDVYDPGGLVKSQIMQSLDNQVCIALNSSSAQNTLANQLYERQSGSGVQHIALRTRDIFLVARTLTDLDVKTLKLPENYYDDLAARFSLDDKQLTVMANYGILYDRDESGGFYQLYLEHFADRFCFEIVQRDGYTGFGAANTPLRSACQSIELNANG